MRILFLTVAFAASLLPAAAQTQFVKARGQQLIAASGEPLLLRGINLGNWLVPEGYMFQFGDGPQSGREIDALFRDLAGPDATDTFWRQWRETYITARDIQLIRALGFNSVRIPFHYALMQDNVPGFRLLDRAIEWCSSAGLYVILDLHAAPGGQTGTNIDDSWGYPWLFESAAAQDATVGLWKRVADHYRNNPTVLGYDLLNEPIPHFGQFPERYNDALEPLYKRIVRAVREVDKNHIVILGGAQWDSNFKVFGPPFDSNAMYTFHKYWTAPTVDVIREYLSYRDKHNVPVWLGESGENTDQWVADFVRTLENEQVGWCFWPYKKMDQKSSVVTFAKPQHWDAVVAYAKLPGGVGAAEKKTAARPSREQVKAAMADLLEQIKFENRRLNDGYIRALGLRVTNDLTHRSRPKR